MSVQSWFLKESKQIVVFADLNFRTLQVPFFDMAFELGLCKILKEAYFELKLKKQVCAFLLTRYPHQRLCNDTHEGQNCTQKVDFAMHGHTRKLKLHPGAFLARTKQSRHSTELSKYKIALINRLHFRPGFICNLKPVLFINKRALYDYP